MRIRPFKIRVISWIRDCDDKSYCKIVLEIDVIELQCFAIVVVVRSSITIWYKLPDSETGFVAPAQQKPIGTTTSRRAGTRGRWLAVARVRVHIATVRNLTTTVTTTRARLGQTRASARIVGFEVVAGA